MAEVKSKWVLAQLEVHLPAGRALCLNADDVPRLLPAVRDDVTPLVFTTRKSVWLPPSLPDISSVVLGWSPAKELVRMQLAMLAEVMEAGMPVFAYGPGDSGIASAARLMADNYTRVSKIAFGSHAQLWRGELACPRPARGIHAWEKAFTLEIAGQTMRLVTLPGVFSHGELDEGTRLLLDSMPLLPKRARVLDFGCGCGVIGAWLKVRQPDISLDLTDVNALAYHATKCTLAANKITGAVVHLEEGLAPVSGQYDVIVSNPPFHKGRKTDQSVVDELFRAASGKLASGGRLIVVANRFLPYRGEMMAQIGATRVLAETRQFWVLEATKRG